METLRCCLSSKGGLLPAHGQSLELKAAALNDANLPEGGTAPAMNGIPASSHSFQVPRAGPQLQPVLKHATRFSQEGQPHTATPPVACFSASAAVRSQQLPGNDTEACDADSTAAAGATKQSSNPLYHSATASPCPAKITKQRKTAAASAKRQQRQQVQPSAANERFDCQQLKLLPEDLPLHSECMVRMQHKSAEPGQASRYIQRARLADQSAQAISEDSAASTAPNIGKRDPSLAWHLCSGNTLQQIPAATRCETVS